MEKLIKAKKERKGITLVSLVVTIIVLLILAGITINLIIGEDGIIKRAQEAGKNYIDAAENEKLQLGVFTNEMDNIIGSSINNERIPYNSEFRNGVVAAINREGVETLETDTDEVIIGNIGKIFEEKTKLDSEVAATAENITQGKQAYVNGQLITGNGSDNQESKTVTDAGTSTSYTASKSGTLLVTTACISITTESSRYHKITIAKNGTEVATSTIYPRSAKQTLDEGVYGGLTFTYAQISVASGDNITVTRTGNPYSAYGPLVKMWFI